VSQEHDATILLSFEGKRRKTIKPGGEKRGKHQETLSFLAVPAIGEREIGKYPQGDSKHCPKTLRKRLIPNTTAQNTAHFRPISPRLSLTYKRSSKLGRRYRRR
jgi:hypothetical protein